MSENNKDLEMAQSDPEFGLVQSNQPLFGKPVKANDVNKRNLPDGNAQLVTKGFENDDEDQTFNIASDESMNLAGTTGELVFGPERSQWGNQLEFMLTCIAFAVGLGNIWRFPYLCYRNGGGDTERDVFVSLFVSPWLCFTINVKVTVADKSNVNSLGIVSDSAVSIDSINTAASKTAPDRGQWSGKLTFILTCVGFAVGLGNIWRFPYMCYRNGGGAFLLPYILMLAFVGLPLFFMELCFGQFASLGPISIWKVNPLFKGLGLGMVMVSMLIGLYYNVVIAHVIFFLFASFASEVPWKYCDYSDWATPYCRDERHEVKATTTIAPNITLNSTVTYVASTMSSIDKIANVVIENASATAGRIRSPPEDYYTNYVLEQSEGIEYMGNLNWKLCLCLLLAWAIVLGCLIRGVQSLGKVVYFTAIFPYIMLTVLLIRGLTLPGAVKGIKFYLTPNFERLSDPRVWSDAATQIFYSLSACQGGLIAMSSFNRFNNNCYRDSLIVSLINCGTSLYAGFVIFSVLGFMAEEEGTTVDKVATGGPGLAFIVYPEAIAKMPVSPLWAILFFIMMLTLGFGSQFSIIETVISAIADEFPEYLTSSKKRNIAYRCVYIFVCFLLGLPMVTYGGIYMLHLIDYAVSGFPLLIVGFLELIAVNWIYGFDRFSRDIFMMLGHEPNIYWKICWKFISPLIMLALVFFNFVEYKTVSYEHAGGNVYTYPMWGQVLSFLVALLPVSAIFLYFAYYYCKEGGWKLLGKLSEPLDDWGPALPENRFGRYADADDIDTGHELCESDDIKLTSSGVINATKANKTASSSNADNTSDYGSQPIIASSLQTIPGKSSQEKESSLYFDIIKSKIPEELGNRLKSKSSSSNNPSSKPSPAPPPFSSTIDAQIIGIPPPPSSYVQQQPKQSVNNSTKSIDDNEPVTKY